MRTRANNTGAIINRKGTNNLYIRYWQDGRQIQEAVGSDSQAEAEALLRRRMVASEDGAVPQQDIKQLRYEDMKAIYLTAKPGQANYCGMPYLDEYFGEKRLTDITSDTLDAFVEFRREEHEVADPTILRNLKCLRAMFNAVRKKGKLGLRDGDVRHTRRVRAHSILPVRRPAPALPIHVRHRMPSGRCQENYVEHD